MSMKVSFQTKWRLVRQVLFILSTSLLVLVQSYEVSAAAKLPPEDKQRLLAYIDTYDSEKLIADLTVKPQIERLLGQELNHLKMNIDAHGPIGIISGILFVSGNAPHKGGLEHGFVGINLYDGSVYAALLTEGKIKVYGKDNVYSRLPAGVRDWILMTWAYTNLNGKTPPNVELQPIR